MKTFKTFAIAAFAICSFALTSCEKETIEPKPTTQSTTQGGCDEGCQSVQCYAKTQSGARCQRITTNCCGYCWQHK